jgi:hypothetical protein
MLDLQRRIFNFVGVTRFELATPRPPDGYATRLRYTPNFCRCKSSHLFFLCKKID